jgi:glycosyltransferase involved in cell wall biosynthesis
MWRAPGTRVLLTRLYFAIPGSLDRRTGGTIYDRKVLAALRESGWRVEILSWPEAFPFPSQGDRAEVASSLAAVPDDALVLIDGLALGTLPDLARREMNRLRLVALVHHPLALETGLSPTVAAAFASQEKHALTAVRHVIVTSETTATILRDTFGVPPRMITVALPGVDRPQQLEMTNRPSTMGDTDPLRIFSMGSISPRKAHHVLVEALGHIKALDFTCAIAGDLTRDPQTATALQTQIRLLGLQERVQLLGEVSEHQAATRYAAADIFALASVYEGYGMVFAEAQAHGLPIVATTGGAIPEVMPRSAGLLVPPHDANAFAEALRALITDPQLRESLAAGSRAAGLRLQGWDQTAAAIAIALESVNHPRQNANRA